VVQNLEELDRYRWSGHGVLIGNLQHDWQEKEYVLSQFGRKERQSVRAYRKFIEEERE
jgi:nicotinamide mononucleotide adenylyltransferase